MEIVKKRSTAFVFLAIIICLSAVLGSYRSVLSLRQQAEIVFTQGERGDGLGIAHDLQERAQLAGNLATVSARYFNGQNALLTQLNQASDGLLKAQTPKEYYQANYQLGMAFQAVYEALEAQPLTKKDSDYRERLRADFNSRNATISHNSYNKLAQNFNDGVLGGFPGGTLAAVAGVQPLELYR